MSLRERLAALRPTVLRVLGYPLVFSLFFVVFLYATFPYDRLAEMIVAQIEAPRVSRTTGAVIPSGIELTIGHLGPTFLPGLEARDVTVRYLPATPGGRAVTMDIERARVRVSLFALLLRRASVSFSVKGLGGEAEGEAVVNLSAPRPGLRSMELRLTDIGVGSVGPLVQAVGLPMSGTATGTVNLEIPNGLIAQATGAVQMAVSALSIGDGRAQYQIPRFGGVTIEQIRAGRLDVNVAVRNGVATFERTGSHSAEFDLGIDGRVTLRPVLADSGMNLGVRFRFTDVYRNKSEQAGRILTVIGMVPDLRRALRPDGMYAFRCSGTFARPPVCGPEGGTPGVGGGGFGMGVPAGIDAPMPMGLGP